LNISKNGCKMKCNGPRVKSGEGSMADRKKRFRIGLVVLVAISLFVCPLAAGGFGLGGANAQIAFTPNVSNLVLTQTVEGVSIGAFAWEAGMTFDCPRGEPESCLLDPSTEVVSIVGDEEFGYGEIRDSGGLYAVWVTDERGTHYLVVDGSDPQLTADRADHFASLVSDRAEDQAAIDERMAEIDGERGLRYGLDVGSLATILVGAGACTFITVGGCILPFAAGALTLVGNAMAHASAQASLEATLPALQEELAQTERNLIGRFEAMAGG
jgi:hypothetical protein